MKKIYTAPEANLLCFEPQENLAGIFEDLNNGAGNQGTADGSFDQISGVIQLPQN